MQGILEFSNSSSLCIMLRFWFLLSSEVNWTEQSLRVGNLNLKIFGLNFCQVKGFLKFRFRTLYEGPRKWISKKNVKFLCVSVFLEEKENMREQEKIRSTCSEPWQGQLPLAVLGIEYIPPYIFVFSFWSGRGRSNSRWCVQNWSNFKCLLF